MKLLPILTVVATLGVLALRPAPVRAQTEQLPYTLTQGFYQGSFVRLAPADGSTPERGEVRLEISSDGRLFGVFVPTSGTVPALFTSFRGQMDPASRRGFLKVSASAGPGGSAVVPPGSEKIALFLYPDGRLVGGNVDAQGTATALRATFLPLVFLPVPSPTP